MSTALGAVFAALFGAIIGSFLNVVAYRLPLGESLATPGSRCPSCGTPIKPYDNVPVLSWLLLRGRCRACGAKISPRYPIVEAVTALLCALVVIAKGADEDALLGLAMVVVLVPITLIDLDHFIIPNSLVLVGSALALAILALTDPDSIVENLIAAAVAGGFLLAAVIAYPRGMGMGDPKLAAMLGLFLGRAVGPALFAAMILGSLVGGLIIARKGVAAGRKTRIPFGPYLAAGGLVGLFAGDAIVDWYLDTFV